MVVVVAVSGSGSGSGRQIEVMTELGRGGMIVNSGEMLFVLKLSLVNPFYTVMNNF